MKTLYTYHGFTGTLRDCCFVFDSYYEEAKDLIKRYNIEDTLAMSKMSYEKSCHKRKEKTIVLSPEAQKYAKENMSLVEDYILQRSIVDEDTKQDLYMQYLNAVGKTEGKYSEEYQRKLKITDSVHRCYLQISRKKYIENGFQSTDVASCCTEDPFEDICLVDLDEKLDDIFDKYFSKMEKAIIIKLYGFAGKKMTREEVAKELGVSSCQIRTIETRILRRLRHPSKSRIIKDFY